MLERIRFTTSIRFLESRLEGKEWDICAIEEGFSKNSDEDGNRIYYSAETLEAALPIFDGAQVHAHKLSQMLDHLPMAIKDAQPFGLIEDCIGWLKDPKIQTLPNGKKGIVCRFHVSENAENLRKLLRDAFEHNQEIAGFSIDAQGESVIRRIEGKSARCVTKITKLDTLDLVSNPAAGGRLLRLVASHSQATTQETNKMPKRILDLIKINRPGWLDGFGQNIRESNSLDALTQILEVSVQRATQELGKCDRKGQRFIEVARGVATLQTILKLVVDGNMEEASALIEEWIAAYPPNGNDNGNGNGVPEIAPAAAPAAETAPVVVPVVTSTRAGSMRESVAIAVMTRLDRIEGSIASAVSSSRYETALKASGLPDHAQKRLSELFEGRDLTDQKIQEAIVAEKNYIAKVNGNRVRECGARVSVGTEEKDRWKKAMDGMICGRTIGGVRQFISLHESYRQITGRGGTPTDIAFALAQNIVLATPGAPSSDPDEQFRRHHESLRESAPLTPRYFRETLLTTDWSELFGDSIRRELIAQYQGAVIPDWRRVVSKTPALLDFRTNRRIRVGGFGDLTTVAEGGTYIDFTEPTDEEVTYAAEKRGNTFSITMETLTNDDLGKIQRLPEDMGKAAARTLSKFVLNTNLSDNPLVDYDGTALFIAGHSNFQTAALSEASLQVAIKQIRKQTEKDSGERIGLMPRILVVPPDLEDEGWELVNSRVKKNASEDATVPSIIRERFRLELLVNIWQIDIDNWQLLADPAMCPTIELGFLNGQEEPEMFIQDQPTIGSVFSADKITYKIRHIYGGDVLDHRCFAGSVV